MKGTGGMRPLATAVGTPCLPQSRSQQPRLLLLFFPFLDVYFIFLKLPEFFVCIFAKTEEQVADGEAGSSLMHVSHEAS